MIDVEKGLREIEDIVQRAELQRAELQRIAKPEVLKLAIEIAEILIQEDNALIEDVLYASLFVFACKSQNVTRKNCEDDVLMMIKLIYGDLFNKRGIVKEVAIDIVKQVAIDVAERINMFNKEVNNVPKE